MRAKVCLFKGSLSNTFYYGLTLNIHGLDVTLQMPDRDYMRLWSRGWQYESMGQLFEEIAEKINQGD